MRSKNLESAFLYMTQLLDEYKNLMKPSRYQHCTYIIERFYNWYCKGSPSADNLYHLIYYKNDLDSKSIVDYAECGEVGENETIHYMWESILSILMIMIGIAYQDEGAAYIPQDIESINMGKIDAFLEKIQTKKAPKELFACLKEICH